MLPSFWGRGVKAENHGSRPIQIHLDSVLKYVQKKKFQPVNPILVVSLWALETGSLSLNPDSISWVTLGIFSSLSLSLLPCGGQWFLPVSFPP